MNEVEAVLGSAGKWPHNFSSILRAHLLRKPATFPPPTGQLSVGAAPPAARTQPRSRQPPGPGRPAGSVSSSEAAAGPCHRSSLAQTGRPGKGLRAAESEHPEVFGPWLDQNGF